MNGSNYDDIIRGDNDNNSINGNSGDDTLYGLAGDDILRGEGGDDTLYGGADNDILQGLNGDDVLSGGSGDDRLDGYSVFGTEFDKLTGGTGSDTFILGVSWGVSYLETGYAIITDWDWEYDFFEVVGSANDYSLGSTNFGIGNSALDTAIYYEGNVIAWVQDSSNIDIFRDFVFV